MNIRVRNSGVDIYVNHGQLGIGITIQESIMKYLGLYREKAMKN